MAYYDQIAQYWHKATGYKGGSFKKHVLNEILVLKMRGISGKAILELGAGNGYFMPLAQQHFSGQLPQRIVISDKSTVLLAIAETQFHLSQAEYLPLDIRDTYPFEDDCFDLILTTMVFNEVSTAGLKRALRECHRVLKPDGLLLVTVTHPQFIENLDRRNLLKKAKNGILTMPGSDQLRLPVVPRRIEEYERLLFKTGFIWEATDVYMTEKVLNEKPGLSYVGHKPLALVLECWKQPI